MLQNLSEDIRECLGRAEECKRLSKTALTPSAIKDYLDSVGWLWPAAMSLQKGCRVSSDRSGAKRRGMKQNRMYKRPYAQSAKQKSGSPASSRMGIMSTSTNRSLVAAARGNRAS
jgi:hypothetical protein